MFFIELCIMNKLSFLIKPVSYQCNMVCDYCFYKRVGEIYPAHMRTMEFDITRCLTESAINTGAHHVSFCWQGGEPTLAGLDFFKEIIALQNRCKKSYQVVENSIQTNGILFNDEWCRFIKQNNILIGISLDGNKEIHDAYRKDFTGRGSFEKVMRAIALMNEHGVQYNILTMLTDANVSSARELYAFYRDHNFTHIQFIPCFERDHHGNLLPYSVSGFEVGKFYCEFFSEWYRDGFPHVSIRLFQDLLIDSFEQLKTSCCWLEVCNSYIVVEHNGDCYPCDFFVYPEWHLGNIMNLSLDDILHSDVRHRFSLRKKKNHEKCSGCDIMDFCRGDCIRFRYKDDEKSAFCEAWKMLCAHYKKHEKELVRRIAQLQEALQSGEFYKMGRNDPCPCGASKKFKKCCGRAPLVI